MRRSLIFVALFSLLLPSCTPPDNPLTAQDEAYGNAPETVFLYVIHGVFGADSMTVRGPSGRIVRQLEYGDRAAKDGVCPEGEMCIPIAVDRARGTTLTVNAGGHRTKIDLSEELAAFYPKETGTVIFRGPATWPQATVVRHAQSISQGCALTVVNSLSVDELPGQTAEFRIATEYRMSADEVGYFDETDEPILTRCGPLPTDHDDHRAIARQELRKKVLDNPWFFRTACDQPGDCFAWGVSEEERPAVLGDDGSFETVPTTDAYHRCLREAITTSTCPDGALGWEDVEVDWLAVADCGQPVRDSAVLTPPGASDTFSGNAACETELRVRTPGLDLIFGPEPGAERAHHGDGRLMRDSGVVSDGAERFWVLLGRPVEPSTFSWDSSQTYVDLESVD